MTEREAAELLEDNVWLGTVMLALGEVNGLVSGAIHSTANTIRPALQIIKTRPGASVVSSVFFMCLPDQVVVYGDCAVNPRSGCDHARGHRDPERRLGRALWHPSVESQ